VPTAASQFHHLSWLEIIRVHLVEISGELASSRLSGQGGSFLPQTVAGASWFASDDEVVLGAIMPSEDGSWRYALFVRTAAGEYQRLKVNDGYETESQARAGLFNQSDLRQT
jgi:hypothetical protein